MTVAEKYLEKEYPYIFDFLKKFHKDPSKIKVKIDFDTKGQYSLMLNFPLPKSTILKDGTKHIFLQSYEKFLFVLNNYPEQPPIGFHITKYSENKKAFEQIFGTHLYNNAILEDNEVKEELNKRWYWICFHYNNHNWNYNRNDVRKGDSLSYFLYYIYYKILGLDNISHE